MARRLRPSDRLSVVRALQATPSIHRTAVDRRKLHFRLRLPLEIRKTFCTVTSKCNVVFI